MDDPIMASFLEQQEIEAMELDRASDRLHIEPIGPRPRQRYILHFDCGTLVRTSAGITEANGFDVGIYIPADYWERAVASEIITLLWPVGLWHSNVRFPFICPGRLVRGTPLVDIIMQVHAILTFQKITIREDDSLQPEASSWARENIHRFPIDPRPLRRRRITFQVRDVPAPEAEKDNTTKTPKPERSGRNGEDAT